MKKGQIESVAFKELMESHEKLLKESKICEMVSHHGKQENH